MSLLAISRLVALLAAYLFLLWRWFHDPSAGLGEPRATSLAGPVVAFAVLAAFSVRGHRNALAGMLAELRAVLRLDARGRALLALVLLASLLFQLPVMFFPAGLLHADAAINGLMGMHIAEGRVAPSFYYGQEFMGTLFSHVLALVFVFTGPFAAGITLLGWVFYAGFLAGLFFLVCRASGDLVAFGAAAWLALPPALMITTLAQSEYAQLLLLATWGLVVVAGAVAGRLPAPGWWVVAGALLGLAFWAHAIAVVVVAAAAASAALLLPPRRIAAAGGRAAFGFVLGLAPGLVGWGARFGSFVEWFLQGGGREGDATLGGALTGMARVSLGNLLAGSESRELLPGSVGWPLLALVVASALVVVVDAVRARVAGAPDARARAAYGLPLGLFVLLQLAVLVGRGYTVIPSQYVVPLYLGVPAVVAMAADTLLGRRQRAGLLVAAAMLAAAGVPLPGTIAFLGGLPDNQASMNASLGALHAAGVDACRGPYWDAYRISFLTREAILCESSDVVRVPGYGERVSARVAARGSRAAAFVAAPQRRDALQVYQYNLEAAGIGWVRLSTPRFEALLPRR
jgi:hypothetical protein